MEPTPQGGKGILRGEHREDTGDGVPAGEADANKPGGRRGDRKPVVRGVEDVGVSADGVGLTKVGEFAEKRKDVFGRIVPDDVEKSVSIRRLKRSLTTE